MTRVAYCLTLPSLLQATARSQQRIPTQSQSEPLGRYLAPDGTPSTPTGFSGILDPAGWRMTTSGATGAQRFTKVTASVPEDSLWDDQFGWDPLNPAATITHELPATSHLTLTIYNTMGQEIATLINGVQDAGYRWVMWNAQNLASGFYLYRVTATSGNNVFTGVRKMLVLN